MTRQPHIVAIPAKNEAGHISTCLAALAGQAAKVLLLVNDSSDGTDRVAVQTAASLGLDLTVTCQQFPPGQGGAGRARRMAMDLAAALVPGAALLTTDADARVAPGWVAANLAHLATGADAVAGRAVIDPVDAAAIPARLHEDDRQECALAAALDEIASILDPDPGDPWPRHTEQPGASICVTADAFARAGGIPDVPLGEDRAFFAALRRVDAVVRHAPDVIVTVSGRVYGRAQGGMADTIRRRLSAPDPFLDDALEPVDAAARRAWLRARARAAWHEPSDRALLADLAHDLGIGTSADLPGLLDASCFGAAWAGMEARYATLARTRVPAACVDAELARAHGLLASLRISPALRTGPSGMSRPVDALTA